MLPRRAQEHNRETKYKCIKKKHANNALLLAIALHVDSTWKELSFLEKLAVAKNEANGHNNNQNYNNARQLAHAFVQAIQADLAGSNKISFPSAWHLLVKMSDSRFLEAVTTPRTSIYKSISWFHLLLVIENQHHLNFRLTLATPLACAQSTGTTCSNVPRYQSNAPDRRANQVMAERDACTGNLTCLGAFTFSLD